MNDPIRRSAALASLALLAACASPTPPPVLLTLPPAVTAPTTAAATGPASPVLVVRRVRIPEYLVARRVRYRADASTLAEWPNTYWAERIEIGVSREFVAALRQQLPGWVLCDETCGDRPAALSMQLELVPMEYLRASQKLQARVRITLSTTGGAPRELSAVEQSHDVTAAADTPQAQAQAIAELLRRTAGAAAPLVLAARP